MTPAEPALDVDALRTGYAASAEHLGDELGRIDRLVRAGALVWRRTIGLAKTQKLWGIPYVGGDEIDAYLAGDFGPPGVIPEPLRNEVEAWWRDAERRRDAIDARLARTSNRVWLPIEVVRRRFGLTGVESDLMLLCLLPEYDLRYRRLFAYLQDDATSRRPSAELALRILAPLVPDVAAGRRLLGAGSALARHRIVSCDGEVPLPMRTLSLDERIASVLLGADAPDPRLTRVLAPERHDGPEQHVMLVTGDVSDAIEAGAIAWARARAAGQGLCVVVRGPEGGGKLSAAKALAGLTRTALLRFDVGAALAELGAFHVTVDLALREAVLADAAIYWADADRLLHDEALAGARARWLRSCDRHRGLWFVASGQPWEPRAQLSQPRLFHLELPLPAYELRKEHWRTLLRDQAIEGTTDAENETLCARLAGAFRLTPGQTRAALRCAFGLAARRPGADGRLSVGDLHEGCRRQATTGLGELARRIEPRGRASFDDLVLPTATKQHVLELRDRIALHHEGLSRAGLATDVRRGQGLVALLAGGSGVGKTYTAELLAQEQHVDLYKVDLSAILSKFVGECERNLRKLFDTAESASALLFLDEGDGLFGRRGGISQGQDRWANLEVNYLLQRLEEHPGVVLIATNLKQNIDEAFLRRIHVVIDYPFPDATCRFEIWKRLLPIAFSTVPDAILHDVAERFLLSGGSIRNVVMDALARALAASAPGVVVRDLVAGIAREYQKTNKPLSRGEFGAEYYEWVRSDILEPPHSGCPAGSV
jgi:hypothetical protein